GPIAQATDDGSIRSTQLRPNGSTDAVAERAAIGADQAPLALVKAKGHEVIGGAEIFRDDHGIIRQDFAGDVRQVVRMNGRLGGQVVHLFLMLPGTPLALLTQAGSAALDMRLAGIVLLPEAVERLQQRFEVAPDTNV